MLPEQYLRILSEAFEIGFCRVSFIDAVAFVVVVGGIAPCDEEAQRITLDGWHERLRPPLCVGIMLHASLCESEEFLFLLSNGCDHIERTPGIEDELLTISR